MRPIKILMFGWEFPPFNSGGLGVACEGLAKALSQQGAQVIFVLPRKVEVSFPFGKIIFALEAKAGRPSAFFSAYKTSDVFQNIKKILGDAVSPWSHSLVEEVALYAKAAEGLALIEDFDVIHVHDWLCYPAGLAAKRVSKKPLVVHIHATEFDRTGGLSINQFVYETEKQGFSEADAVIAVSNFTKEKVVKHYGITPQKVKVVHNAIDGENIYLPFMLDGGIKDRGKLVLFLGRLTLQKGPDYFLKAAKKVLEVRQDVFFLIAGSGDMERQIINEAVELGISDKIIFTGFLRGGDLEKIYQMADLYVLSSVSEPFGLTVLEALQKGTPVLASRQSGVSEIVRNCLKVDFWDIEQMANKILAVLNYQELQEELKENGLNEVKRFTWQEAAQKCINVYKEVLR